MSIVRKLLPKHYSGLPVETRKLNDECQGFFYGWSDHIWWSIDVIRNAFLSVDPYQPDGVAGPWIPLLELYNVVIEQGDYLGQVVKNPEYGHQLSQALVNHVHQARLLILILVQGGRGLTPENAWDPFYLYAEDKDPSKIEKRFGFGAGGAFNYFPVPISTPVGNVAPVDVTNYLEVGYSKPFPDGLTFDEGWAEWLLNGQEVTRIYSLAFGLSDTDTEHLSMCMNGHLVSTIVEYVALLNARNKFLVLLTNPTYFTGPDDAKVPTDLMNSINECIGTGELQVYLDSNNKYNFYLAREGKLSVYNGDAEFNEYFNAMQRCLSLADDTAGHLYDMGYNIRHLCEKYVDKKDVLHFNDRFDYLVQDFIWWVGLYLRAYKGRPYINMGMLDRLYTNAQQFGNTFGEYTTQQAGTNLSVLLCEGIDMLINFLYTTIKETVDPTIYIPSELTQTRLTSAYVLQQISVKISTLITNEIGNGNSVSFTDINNRLNNMVRYALELINVIVDPNLLIVRQLEASLGGNAEDIPISNNLYDAGETYGNFVTTYMENNLNITGIQVHWNSLNVELTNSHDVV
jgi:hypothetical protein